MCTASNQLHSFVCDYVVHLLLNGTMACDFQRCRIWRYQNPDKSLNNVSQADSSDVITFNHMLFKPSTVDEETHQNQGPRCEEGQFPKVLYRWSSKYCQRNDCCEVEESQHAKTKGHDKLLPVRRRVRRAFQCFILQAINKHYEGFKVWQCLDMQAKGVDLTTYRSCIAFLDTYHLIIFVIEGFCKWHYGAWNELLLSQMKIKARKRSRKLSRSAILPGSRS